MSTRIWLLLPPGSTAPPGRSTSTHRTNVPAMAAASAALVRGTGHGPVNGNGLRSARAPLSFRRRIARHLVHAADHRGAVQTAAPGPDRGAVIAARLDRRGLAR